MSRAQNRHRFYVQLVRKDRVSSSLLHLVFHATEGLEFVPGQFVSLRKPRTEGGLGRPRCYSLAGRVKESREEGLLEFCIALRDTLSPEEQRHSFPHYLESLSVGQRLECSGPFGHFIWDERTLEFALSAAPQLERVCWIGTGSGIAPLRSMILSEVGPASGQLPNYALLQGARNREQLIYADEFRSISPLDYYPCLSREAITGDQYFPGRVTDQLRVLARTWNFSRTLFFICGSHALVADVRRLLTQEFRTPDALILSEGFGEEATERKVTELKVAEKKAA